LFQLLLSLARSLFQEQMSLERLVTTIIKEAKDLLKCERCTFYLLDLKMYDAVSKWRNYKPLYKQMRRKISE
jgi:cGMP-specific 3',5'-cyclic phosphodiesterase